MTTTILPSHRMFWAQHSNEANYLLALYPDFGFLVKRERCEEILHELRFVEQRAKKTLSNYKLWHMRSFFEAFSVHFACAQNPGTHLCEDETIGPWTGRGTERRPAMPSYQKIVSKPHNGRMIKDICCAESGFIVSIDVVEASSAKRGGYEDKQSVSAATQLRLAKPYFGSMHIVYADSWFGRPEPAAALKKHGLLFISQVKKQRYSPRGFPRSLIEDVLKCDSGGTLIER